MAAGSMRCAEWVESARRTTRRSADSRSSASSSSRSWTVPNGLTGSQTTIIFVRSVSAAPTWSGSRRQPFDGPSFTKTGVAPASRNAGTKWKYPGSVAMTSSPGSRQASAAYPTPAWAPSVPMTSNPSSRARPSSPTAMRSRSGASRSGEYGPTRSAVTAARIASSTRGDGPMWFAIQPRSAHSERSRAIWPSR